MAIQDLYQALQIFQNGVNQLSATRVLSRANEITNEIRNSEVDQAQKTNALRNLGQQIAFGLAGNPAMNAASLQQVLETFPQRPQVPQSALQAFLSDDPQMQAKAKEYTDYAAEIEAEKTARAEERAMKRIQLQDKLQRERETDRFERNKNRQDPFKETTLLQDFRDKSAKGLIESIEAGYEVEDLLAEGQSPVALSVAVRKLLKSAGEDKITDQDFQSVSPNQSIYRRLQEKAKLALTNDTTEFSRDEVILVAKAARRSSERRLRNRAKRFATSRRRVLSTIGSSPQELEERLMEEYFDTPPSTETNTTEVAPESELGPTPAPQLNFRNYIRP